jgi:hypothetical protein
MPPCFGEVCRFKKGLGGHVKSIIRTLAALGILAAFLSAGCDNQKAGGPPSKGTPEMQKNMDEMMNKMKGGGGGGGAPPAPGGMPGAPPAPGGMPGAPR